MPPMMVSQLDMNALETQWIPALPIIRVPFHTLPGSIAAMGFPLSKKHFPGLSLPRTFRTGRKEQTTVLTQES